MFAIPATRALDVMGRCSVIDRAGIGVAQLDWSVWAQAVPSLVARPRFADSTWALGDRLRRWESESPRALAAAILARGCRRSRQPGGWILREIIAKVFRLPASKLDLDQNLNQLGIDSLMAVELQTLVAEQTGVHFSPMDFMAGPSIMTMASRLLEKLLPGENATTPADSMARSETKCRPARCTVPQCD